MKDKLEFKVGENTIRIFAEGDNDLELWLEKETPEGRKIISDNYIGNSYNEKKGRLCNSLKEYMNCFGTDQDIDNFTYLMYELINEYAWRELTSEEIVSIRRELRNLLPNEYRGEIK